MKREIYLEYFQSESIPVRNQAYLSALAENLCGSSEFLFEELLAFDSEVVKANLALLFKIKPHLWDAFICKLQRLSEIPVNVITSLAGIVTFYRVEGLDYGVAENLVKNYEAKGDDANELLLGLLVCLQNSNLWLAKVQNLVKNINAKIEDGLLQYMESNCLLYGESSEAIKLIAKEVNYELKNKIVQKLLLKYGNNHKIVYLVIDIINQNKQGLTAFLYGLIEYLNDKKYSQNLRFAMIDTILTILNNKDIKVSQYQSKCFFASLAEWMQSDWCQRLGTIERYLEKHPGDKLKIFRLYDQMIILYALKNGIDMQSMRWFKASGWTKAGLPELISVAFKKDFFLAVRRYGALEEKTQAYLLALYAMTVDDCDINTKAQEILNLLIATPRLDGSVNEILSDLEYVLEKNSRARPYVNCLLDLILSSKSPLNDAKVLDIMKLYSFCNAHGLNASVFRKMYHKEIVMLVEGREKSSGAMTALQEVFDAL